MAVTDWSTGALACSRSVLFWLFCVVPKPTYSTVVPSVSPSLPTATGITGVFAGALNWSMQKSSIGADAFGL